MGGSGIWLVPYLIHLSLSLGLPQFEQLWILANKIAVGRVADRLLQVRVDEGEITSDRKSFPPTPGPGASKADKERTKHLRNLFHESRKKRSTADTKSMHAGIAACPDQKGGGHHH